jgi:membrane fusion protein (multidrug efflux system)
VRAGDVVSAGQPLASLEAGPLEDEVAVGMAALQAAEAEAKRAARDLQKARDHRRRLTALGQQLAPAEERSSARFDEQQKAALLDAARAVASEKRTRLDQLQQNASDGMVRAPFAGTVARRFAEPGQEVSRTSPLVRLLGGERPIVRFALSPGDGPRLTPGTPLRIQVESSTRTIGAVVEKVTPEVDAVTGILIAEAQLTGDIGQEVVPGLPVRVFPVTGAEER